MRLFITRVMHLAVLILLIGHCPHTRAQGYRILPLGNSLTQGWGTPPVAERVGYRLQFYNEMTDAGYDIDMVGHQTAGWEIMSHPEHAGTPNFKDQHVLRLLQDGFDVLNNIQITPGSQPFLEVYPADIILLHIGTNDILNGEGNSVSTVSEILQEISNWEMANSKNVTVFLARIINTVPNQPQVSMFNSNLESMVSDLDDPNIVLLDMENGAGIEYTTTDFEEDGIHLKQSGYDKMGMVWSAAVESFLDAPPVSPGGLNLSDITANSIRLTWIDNSINETGFEIQRSQTVGSAYQTIHVTGRDVAYYNDNTVSSGQTYYYRLCSVNDNGRSEFTLVESASTPGGGDDIQYIGNERIYESTTSSDFRRAMQITFSESGMLQGLSIYHNGGSGGLIMGVYSDASGSPGARLALTPEVEVSSSAGWQTVSLTNPVAVSAGQRVWLSWVFESNPGIRYSSGTPARAQSTETWTGGMPSTFGSSTLADYKYSLYGLFTPGGISDTQVNLFQNDNRFRIYPNPINERAILSWDEQYKRGLMFAIINAIGETVKIGEINPGISKIELDLSDHEAGLYLIMINDSDGGRILYRSKLLKIQ